MVMKETGTRCTREPRQEWLVLTGGGQRRVERRDATNLIY